MSKARDLADFISDSTIDATEIADSAVTTAKIADDAVTNAKVGAGAVGTTELADDAVTNAKVGANAIGTTEIADDAVTAGKLAVADNGTSGLALLSDGDGTFSWGASGAPISRYTSEKTFPSSSAWHTIAYLEADDANGPVGNTFRFRMSGYLSTSGWGGVEHTGVLIDQNSLVNTTTNENLASDSMGYGITKTFGDFGLGDLIRGVRVRVNQGNWYALQVKSFGTSTISEFEFEDISNVGWVIVDPVEESTNPASLNDWPGTDGNTVGQAYYNNIFGYQSLVDGASEPAPATYVPGYLATGVLQTTTNGSSLYGTTFNGDASFGDNVKAQFGAGNDLQIYHDGSNSYVDDQGTGSLILRGNGQVQIKGTNNESMAIFDMNGASDLYYNNSKKLATTSSGVSVTGTCTATAFSGDGSGLTGLSGGLAKTSTFQLTSEIAQYMGVNNVYWTTGYHTFSSNSNEIIIQLNAYASSNNSMSSIRMQYQIDSGSWTNIPNSNSANAGGIVGAAFLSNSQEACHSSFSTSFTPNSGSTIRFRLLSYGEGGTDWYINRHRYNHSYDAVGTTSITVLEVAV